MEPDLAAEEGRVSEGKIGGDVRSLLQFIGGLFLLFAGGTEIANNYRTRMAMFFGILLCLVGAMLLALTYFPEEKRGYIRYAVYGLLAFCVLLWVASLK
jgi:hypothetical protein